MTENLSSALTEALADLPAKPRVHELAKRSGLSSKELIAALAERGIQARAASSSVDHDAAVALLTALLGGDTVAGPSAASPVPAAIPDNPAPTGVRPLFLEPEHAPAPRQPRSRRPAGRDEAETAEAAPSSVEASVEAETAEPPKRSRRKPAAEKVDSSDPDIAAAPAADAAGEQATDGAGAPPAARSRRRRGRGKQPDTDGADTETNADVVESDLKEQDGSADGAAADQPGSAGTDAEDDVESSGRRRRRRGRRGRGRPDDDAQADDSNEPQDSAASDSSATDSSPSSRNQAATDGDSAGSDDADDADSDDPDSAGGTRRRRRRRRRSGPGGEDAPREDDPDNTVVHVRDSRGTENNEVQGIRGSTRLEAKRQRRKDSRDNRRRPQILTEAEFLARRESVDRVMAVRQRGDLAQVALLEDNVLVEHFVSQAGADSMIGNIYLGKVQNVLPSMEAAFVDIGRGRNAVLYAGEVNWDSSGLQGKARRIETALSSGDTVLVQVSKDPVGHKGARLTTQIALPGRFLVYVPAGGATGISRKLPDAERKRLKAILDRIVPDDAGVIIRTAAEGVPEEELARDVERLKSQWDEIKAIADGTDSADAPADAAGGAAKGRKKKVAVSKAAAPQQLSAEPDTLIKVVRDLFNSDINRLVIDGDETFASVSAYVNQVAPELAERVSRYESNGDGRDIFTEYRIDEQIAKALERKVHLPSGGSLVIDRTEAMTVVDVNTGKYTGSGGNLEETVTKNNLEAAEEIVRQLRLRDIGGIIVVDFIDMVLEANRELVLRRLTESLGRDRTRHQVAEVTSLGLVQMTRKRMGTGLVEAFSSVCEQCHGRGIVLRDVPLDHSHDDDSDRPTGKKRRERRGRDSMDSETPAEPMARITTLKADPRGPKPPLRSGAPVRSADIDSSLESGDGFLATDEELVATAVRAVSGPAANSATMQGSTTDSGPAPDSTVAGGDAAGVVESPEQSATAAKRSPRRRRATSNGAVSTGSEPSSAEVPAAEPPSAASVERSASAAAEPIRAAGSAPAVEAPAAKPAPRRRRAASRPAGPAGDALPVLVSATSDAQP
ncbi:MAG: translation initiation factor IF-2 N-terminal domain-containing protein, partial [Actinomycetota bacterium]|nr:translation initiation factor IF-2 N-terminal domain-containing protein [Actinomycetota bacterium]